MLFLRNHQENRKKSANYQPITPKSTVSYKQQTINRNQLSPCGPIPHNHLARALMPRQPYSEAVKSDRRSGFLFSPEVSVPYKGNRRGRKDY